MTDQETQNPFGAFPTDPTAFLKMLEDIRERVLGLYNSGQFPGGVPLDGQAFVDALEQVLAQARAAFASDEGEIPKDPLSWFNWVEDNLKSATANSRIPIDTNAFFETFEQVVTKSNDVFNMVTQSLGVSELFNPDYWFNLSERALRHTSDILGNTARAEEESPAATEEEAAS